MHMHDATRSPNRLSGECLLGSTTITTRQPLTSSPSLFVAPDANIAIPRVTSCVKTIAGEILHGKASLNPARIAATRPPAARVAAVLVSFLKLLRHLCQQTLANLTFGHAAFRHAGRSCRALQCLCFDCLRRGCFRFGSRRSLHLLRLLLGSRRSRLGSRRSTLTSRCFLLRLCLRRLPPRRRSLHGSCRSFRPLTAWQFRTELFKLLCRAGRSHRV